MKQFGIVFLYEFRNYLKNKIFVAITILMIVLIVFGLNFPRISDYFSGDEGGAFFEEGGSDGDMDVLLLAVDGADDSLLDSLKEVFGTVFADQYQVTLTDQDAKWIKKQIKSGEAECGFLFTDFMNYTYYVDNLSMYDSNPEIVDEVLMESYRTNMLLAAGVTEEQLTSIYAQAPSHETEKIGKDQGQNFFYTYIMLFALYMVILMYGQMISTGVASEKSSRAMEVLITSVKPNAMMFGKVLAACAAGLLQLVAVFGSAYLTFQANRSLWEEQQMVTSVFDMPGKLLVYMIIFFLLGFFVYAFLYGAIGSVVTKVEDLNTAVMPLMLVFVISFMIVIFSMSDGTVDTLLMKVLSYIPLTSPMAMFTRIAMSTVPFWQILVSMVILLASAVAIGVLSARIYRVGVLRYGNPLNLFGILKLAKKEE